MGWFGAMENGQVASLRMFDTIACVEGTNAEVPLRVVMRSRLASVSLWSFARSSTQGRRGSRCSTQGGRRGRDFPI